MIFHKITQKFSATWLVLVVVLVEQLKRVLHVVWRGKKNADEKDV